MKVLLLAFAVLVLNGIDPALAGEQEFGSIHRLQTSTFNIKGTQWNHFVTNRDALQVDIQSDQPAIASFNVTEKNISIWGGAGSTLVDPVIGINVSKSATTETGGSNLNIEGYQSETTVFNGIKGIQTGTR